MLVRVRAGLNSEICSVSDRRLVKSFRTEIIEKLIEKKEISDLATLFRFRDAQVERLNVKEREELERFDPDMEFVISLDC